jgi:uncharacterized protein
MTDILGYLLAGVIGVSLGLFGGGGSILTVPVLVYVVGLSPVISTAYSLFIVGATSLAGSFNYARQKLVSFRTALVFAAPSLVSVFLVRRFVVHAIPDVVWVRGGFTLTKDVLLMVFFALLMLFASFSMIRSKPEGVEKQPCAKRFSYGLIAAEGMVVGAITGLVGAGGGFMIIPALVLFARLPIRLAVGTSLLIIAANSLIGFASDVASQAAMDWPFLLNFSAIAIGGIFIGGYLSKFIPTDQLKKGFGYFLLAMAAYILIKELT